ncbi:Response regulator receiver [Labilithrix luteola]|uniref:Response regulator receiver n=1 Tax=Labilithrix luteola TaxID=1391654 RepID=A0A0K1PVZ3_9BACT|nr:response regulator [Labilithrix luteola]AKU97294.1 Response regulator receiver [Labilithrix luteola]
MLVDDEGPSRRRLRRMLEQIPGVDVLADEADPIEALARIAELAPDVVFLDIHMPGIDGLTLAERCARVPAIVFVTAHAEHAVRAFDLASVDYLLKPVRIERLEEAVGRVRSRQDRPTEASGSSSAARPGEDAPPRVIAYERGTKVFVDATTITRFRASDKYTAFVSEQRELLTEEPLVALEERLGGLGFVRVHRAELIRLSAVRSFRVEDGAHSVCLKDGQIVPVSRRMAASLRARLGL